MCREHAEKYYTEKDMLNCYKKREKRDGITAERKGDRAVLAGQL